MGFFDGSRPGTSVAIGKARFELPILYFRDDFFQIILTADFARVSALMPSRYLHPVKLFGSRALIAVGAFNYVDSSLGYTICTKFTLCRNVS